MTSYRHAAVAAAVAALTLTGCSQPGAPTGGEDAETATAACRQFAAAAARVDAAVAGPLREGRFTPAVRDALDTAVDQMDSAAANRALDDETFAVVAAAAAEYAALSVLVADYAEADSWNQGTLARHLRQARAGAEAADEACSV